ncbi:MAG: HAD hydrolase-like protein, partial [Alphaproteobacteria bacterium]|nr:HAD hydrolase-like protein [Alphaproteobacteria bacterium]
ALAGGDTFAVKKPDPGHVTGLLAALGVGAHEAVMVGDSGNDALAARGAGLPFIAVTYGYCQGAIEDLSADERIGRFADLPDVVARLGLKSG